MGWLKKGSRKGSKRGPKPRILGIPTRFGTPHPGSHPGPHSGPLLLDPLLDTPQCKGINPLYTHYWGYSGYVIPHTLPILARAGARAQAGARTRARTRARENPIFGGPYLDPFQKGVQKWVKMPKSPAIPYQMGPERGQIDPFWVPQIIGYPRSNGSRKGSK